uniref:Uncharacterized protein n=1 Tax=Arundo donax TaxID=35708 RepID=A0A0A9G0Z3_ARUDO
MTLKYRMFSSDGDALIPGAARMRRREEKKSNQTAYESNETRTVTADSEFHPNSKKKSRKINSQTPGSLSSRCVSLMIRRGRLLLAMEPGGIEQS